MKKFLVAGIFAIGAIGFSHVEAGQEDGNPMEDLLSNFNSDELRQKVDEDEVKRLVFNQLEDMNPESLKKLLESFAGSLNISVDEARSHFTRGIQTAEARNLLKSLNENFFDTIEALTKEPAVSRLLKRVAKNTSSTVESQRTEESFADKKSD